MIWLVLATVAIALLLAGWFLLRRAGTGYRVGRLLGAAPTVPLAQVVAEAGDAPPRYLQTHGRIASDELFPDEQDRPLVFRRERLERADGKGGWQVVDERRLAVAFSIEDRDAEAQVDLEALGEGLVVLPREAVGVARDLPEAWGPIRDTLPPDAPVRVRIEQVSAVEHATVAGVVERTPEGKARLTAGLGRPLILSTVPPDAAMRILAAGQRRSVLASAVLLVAGLGMMATSLVALILGR